MSASLRAGMALLSLGQLLLYVYSILQLVHYFAVPIAFFESPSVVSTRATSPHYLHNFTLYCCFWVQHIVMASKPFKSFLMSLSPKYILFERYQFNVFSALTLIWLLNHVLPAYSPIFTLPALFRWPLIVVGAVLLGGSQWELGRHIFFPYSWEEILFAASLPREKPREPLTRSSVYGLVRHPMQSGVIMLVVGANALYTVEIGLFAVTMVVGVMVGVGMEERRMEGEGEYGAYAREVRWRLVPYLL